MYYDTQNREIEDAEMDNMRHDAKTQPTWNIEDVTHDEIIALARAIDFYAESKEAEILGKSKSDLIDTLTTLYNLLSFAQKLPTLENK